MREAQLLLERPTVQKNGLHSSPPSFCPSTSPPKHPMQEDETNQQAQALCSQPARLQFQTSLDHFSCLPEMNNAHINWCQLINFHFTPLYFFFNNSLADSFYFAKQTTPPHPPLPLAQWRPTSIYPRPERLSSSSEMIKLSKSASIYSHSCKCELFCYSRDPLLIPQLKIMPGNISHKSASSKFSPRAMRHGNRINLE